MNTTDLIRNLPALKRGYEEHKTGKIHRVLKKRIADGRAAERTAKELGSVEQLIDRKLSPVADTIRAQQEQIDDADGNAFRMAAEMAGKLDLTQQEHRVFEALRDTAGNDNAAAQSLIARYGKTKQFTLKVKDPLTGAERKLRRTKGSGYSRANVQLIRERIEKKIGATGYSNPRTFWAKAHPLAHTVSDKPTGKKTGTMPAR